MPFPRLRRLLPPVALCAAGLLTAACERKKVAPPPPGAGPAPVEDAASVAVRHDRPLTPAQREATVELGRDFAAKLTAGDFAAIGRELPVPQLLELALRGVDTGESTRWKQLSDQIQKDHAADPGKLFASLKGCHARFLRLRETSIGPAALVRADLAAGTVTYFDVHPRFDKDGTARLGDFVNHATGLALSDVYRSLFVTLAVDNEPGVLASLFGGEKVDPATLRAFNTAVRAKNATAVEETWPSLPPRLQTDRLFLVVRLQTLMTEPSSAAYAHALEEARLALLNEPVADILSIDLLLLKKDIRAFDECIARLVDRLGGRDGYLVLVRGLARLQAGDAEGAKPFVDAALEMEPDFELAALAKLRLLARLGRHAEACTWLTTMVERFNVSPDSLQSSTDEALVGLLASPEFERWRTAHPAKDGR